MATVGARDVGPVRSDLTGTREHATMRAINKGEDDVGRQEHEGHRDAGRTEFGSMPFIAWRKAHLGETRRRSPP
jgi:hypothetical protein